MNWGWGVGLTVEAGENCGGSDTLYLVSGKGTGTYTGEEGRLHIKVFHRNDKMIK